MPAPRGSSDTGPRASASPNIRLNLSNRPENVMLVRQVLAGFGEGAGLDGGELNDISTAVTEACNNVVLHAYRGGEGPLGVDVYALSSSVEVAVRDRGTGITKAGPMDGEGVGMGLAVITALSDRVDITDGAGGGTEVQMSFTAVSAPELGELTIAQPELPEIPAAALARTVEMAITPFTLARPVLSRLLTALAARAHFRTDRIADLQLVADELAAHAGELTAGPYLRIGASVEPRRIELRVAPLAPGRALRLLDGEIGDSSVLARLTNRQEVSPTDGKGSESGGREMLAVEMLDPR